MKYLYYLPERIEKIFAKEILRRQLDNKTTLQVLILYMRLLTSKMVEN